MKLQDYAKYYIGCSCVNTLFPEGHKEYDRNWKLEGYRSDSIKPYCIGTFSHDTWTDSIKLILRKLEDMTDEDKTEIGKVMEWYKGHDLVGVKHMETMHDTYKNMASDCLIKANSNFDDRLGPSAYFKMLPALTKLGFDLFGLIDAGLAIDSKTLK